MKICLELVNIWKDFKEFKLEKISLKAYEKEYFVVLGPSGAGKTLLLQIIAGILDPDKGKVYIDGVDMTQEPPEKRNVGYVPQNYALFPHLSVYDNIAFGLKIRKLPEDKIKLKVKNIAEKLEIAHLLKRSPRTLSGGEAQRVALARALVIEPKLLLLDEPLAAVDPVLRWELRGYLKKIQSEFETTVIHVTHDFTEALSLANKVAVLNKGVIEQIGTPQEIFYKPKSEFVAWFTRAGNIFKGEAKPIEEGLSIVDLGPVHFTVCGAYEGKVAVMFRPEHVVISKQPLTSSAKNELIGIIDDYVDEGPLVLLKIGVNGLSIKAYVTKSSFYNLGLKRQEKVYLYVKASQIHVIK
ncbi:MAG: hypothetical protein B6U95_07495 [Thermofilum sp. ex4484_82]|nr:MAG: hypothetical protein B6U95_07495 [Thermofilum sp. ex4484_82]OYT37091.1 MAG: hypothetical protein B6U96_07490 [Archaeoglobales archaeon ex4484_92]